jgi:hypothetical protein
VNCYGNFYPAALREIAADMLAAAAEIDAMNKLDLALIHRRVELSGVWIR